MAKIASSSTTLLKELQLELSLGVEQYKADGFSMQDVIDRLKRVGTAVPCPAHGRYADDL